MAENTESQPTEQQAISQASLTQPTDEQSTQLPRSNRKVKTNKRPQTRQSSAPKQSAEPPVQPLPPDSQQLVPQPQGGVSPTVPQQNSGPLAATPFAPELTASSIVPPTSPSTSHPPTGLSSIPPSLSASSSSSSTLPPHLPPSRVEIVAYTVIGVVIFVVLAIDGALWWMGLQLIASAVLVLLFLAFSIAGYTSKRFAWTGFSGYDRISTVDELPSGTLTKTVEPQRGKTLWDWLGLLIIPVMLAAGALWFSSYQSQISLQIAATRYANDQWLAKDQQQETTLKTYIDDITGLMLDRNLQTSKPGSEVRTVARTRTLAALRGLDPKRKGALLQFLYDAQLILRPMGTTSPAGTTGPMDTIISLEGADLSNANLHGLDLHGINLSKANLYRTDLSRAILWDAILDSAVLDNADLDGATLNGALLVKATLHRAQLNGVNLDNADLFRAQLNGANLSGAHLSGAHLFYTQLTGRADLSGADLKGAYLGGADLAGANLRKADLTGADLTGADLTGADLTSATKIQERLKNAKEIKWEVVKADNILLIAYNNGTTLPQYGALDLDNGTLRLGWYDLTDPQLRSGWGTSIILLPALWSKASCPQSKGYCQGGPVTASYQDAHSTGVPVTPENPIGQVKDPNLLLSIQGTVASLPVASRVSLLPPTQKTISAQVTTTVKGKVMLDTNHPGEAFKPIMFSSMHISSTYWDTKSAYVDDQPFPLPFPGDGWIISPQSSVFANQKFGLVGGTSTWKTNAPTVEAQLEQPLSMQVAGRVAQSSNPTNDNVVLWCASDNMLDTWNYTLVVSV